MKCLLEQTGIITDMSAKRSGKMQFIGSALPPTSIFAYFFITNMGVGLILSTALDSRRNLVAECMSRKLICWILRVQLLVYVLNDILFRSVVYWNPFHVFAVFRGN